MFFVPLSLWLSLATPFLTVIGNSQCPTPREVAERVAALLPAAQSTEARDIAHVDAQADVVRLRLERPDGRIVGERLLEKRFGCADLAAAAAVVVAAWESDVHPEFLRTLPAAAPAPVVPDPGTVKAAVPAPPARTGGAAFDIGLALVGAIAPDPGGAGPALGGVAAATWIPAGSGPGGRMAILAGSERDLQLSSGTVRWRRLALALGIPYRLVSETGRWILDLQANGLLARTTMHGVGFVRNLSDISVDPGLGAGVRLMMRSAVVSPWLELSGVGWVRRQVVFEAPALTSRALPRLEAALALGVSFCAWP